MQRSLLKIDALISARSANQRGVLVHELTKEPRGDFGVRLVYLVELIREPKGNRILLSLPYCGVRRVVRIVNNVSCIEVDLLYRDNNTHSLFYRRVEYSLFIFKINISYLFTTFNENGIRHTY